MPHHCCVPGCTSNSRDKTVEAISFHSFPKDRALRPRSHYVRNDGDGDGTVTFYRSHYTFRNVNVNVALT